MSKTEEADYNPSQSEKADQRARIEEQTAEFLEGNDIEEVEQDKRTIVLSADKIKKAAWRDPDSECKK
jgi:hypothetical protein